MPGPNIHVKIVDPRKDFEVVKTIDYTMNTKRGREVGRQIVSYLKVGFAVISVPEEFKNV